MGMGKWGLLAGLGQGMADTGKLLFSNELMKMREDRLQQIKDQDYARSRADTKSDLIEQRQFDAEQSRLDREASDARYDRAYSTDLERYQTRRDQLIQDGASPEDPAIKEIDAAIKKETSITSSSPSNYNQPLYWASKFLESGIALDQDEARRMGEQMVSGNSALPQTREQIIDEAHKQHPLKTKEQIEERLIQKGVIR